MANAVQLARRAVELSDPAEGPWSRASRQVLLAFLLAQLGRHAEAAVAARAALPVLDRLGAHDDAVTMRAAIAVAALVDGRLDDAEQVLAEARERIGPSGRQVTFGMVLQIAEAELALLRGHRDLGLGLLDELVREVVDRSVPSSQGTGLEPWVAFPQSLALTAHAVYGGVDGAVGAGGARLHGDPGADLYADLSAKALVVLRGGGGRLDFPVAGMTLFALGAWALIVDQGAAGVEGSERAERAVRVLVLAERFGYSRFLPVMAWRHVAATAEARAPGRIDAWREVYAGRRGPDLLSEARAAVAALDGPGSTPRATSSGTPAQS